MKTIQAVTYLVNDYDEAISWFKTSLDFVLLVDVDIGGGLRFIRIAPNVDSAFSLVLAKHEQSSTPLPGQQALDVFLFLQTDDFEQDYAKMKSRGVNFLETPRNEVYAKVVVFEDLYGNKWDLLEPKNMAD